MPLVQAMETNPAMANAVSIAVVWRQVDAVMAVLLPTNDRGTLPSETWGFLPQTRES